MIWLRLKLDLLPIIAQEVDRVAKEYMRKNNFFLYIKKKVFLIIFFRTCRRSKKRG